MAIDRIQFLRAVGLRASVPCWTGDFFFFFFSCGLSVGHLASHRMRNWEGKGICPIWKPMMESRMGSYRGSDFSTLVTFYSFRSVWLYPALIEGEDTQGKEYRRRWLSGATLESASRTLNSFCPLFCSDMDISWTASLRLLPFGFLLGFANGKSRQKNKKGKRSRNTVEIFLFLPFFCLHAGFLAVAKFFCLIMHLTWVSLSSRYH